MPSLLITVIDSTTVNSLIKFTDKYQWIRSTGAITGWYLAMQFACAGFMCLFSTASFQIIAYGSTKVDRQRKDFTMILRAGSQQRCFGK